MESILPNPTTDIPIIQDLKSTKSSLDHLFMQAPAMIAILKGKEHEFELVNPYYQNLFGDRQLVGKKLLDALPELKDQSIPKILDQVYLSGQTYYGNEQPITLARNAQTLPEQIFFNFIYQALITDAGNIDGIIVFAYEVTELVKARVTADEYRQRMQFIVESIPMISWISNPDGTTEYLNASWYQYTGTVNSSQVPSWSDQIHVDDQAMIAQFWTQSSTNKNMWQAEYRIKDSEGKFRWHLGKSVPVRDNSGNIIHWVGTASDIHDRKTYQEQLEKLNDELLLKNEQLERTNADLDNFLYMASHDLKAPIANLEGLLNAYFEDVGDNEFNVFYQELMFKSVDRFKRTIQELTEISKVQRDIEVNFEELHFENTLNEVKSDIKELILRKDATIHTQFLIPEIFCTKRVLRSVIYNLLSNSLKYSSPERKPHIFLSTFPEDEYIVLAITDNGLGLTTDDKKKIFMLFKRVHQHEEGTGVGLYMVKKMVENTGGRIEVESEKGKGSTFRVYFKKKL